MLRDCKNEVDVGEVVVTSGPKGWNVLFWTRIISFLQLQQQVTSNQLQDVVGASRIAILSVKPSPPSE